MLELSRFHIVGGGLQGCFLAIALQHELGISPKNITIYDPQPRLLHNWFTRTESCKMQYLRSNSSHSIHVDFNALRNFARKRGMNPWKAPQIEMPYFRPSIELFNAHAQHCIQRYNLQERQNQVRVEELNPDGAIVVAGKELPGIVLFTANTTRPYYPTWAKHLPNVQHVYSNGANTYINNSKLGLVVLGSGISAVQLATKLAQEGRLPRLITRKPLVRSRFDFTPCYTGTSCLETLPTINSGNDRLRMETILSNRYSGRVPGEILDNFRKEVKNGRAYEELIENEKEIMRRVSQAEATVLCTGLQRSLDPLLAKHGKFVKGYPVLPPNLKWGKAVFVAGEQAMYTVGPAAPNIIGAHLAWRIIKDQLKTEGNG